MSIQQKTSILILDDEPIVLKRLKPTLEKNNFEVEVFFESAGALQRTREREFDIIITDLKMEGADGMEFLSDVKKRSPRTEIIVITGFATPDTAKECFEKGVFDFLAKPFRLNSILETIKRAEEKLKGAD
ncbi:MAG: response regulator [bacterium]|nr:response regulator [bacterium]